MHGVANKCPKCHKTVVGNSRGSLTSWLFRQSECQCEILDKSGQIALFDSDNTPAEKPENAIRKSEPRENLVGQLIDDRYEIVALVGSGGMGDVYKAVDQKTGINCAIKLLSPHLLDQKLLAKRLAHEAKAARALSHPNIVPVFDNSSNTSITPYLVMGLVNGRGLDEVLAVDRTLPSERALDIFIQITEALVHAHEKGIIHRDIKPSNILLGNDDDAHDFVRIVDFGISKIVDDDRKNKTNLTQTGELVGSPLYMSPEQCRGEELDARSDLYSLGCVMFETLAGRPPFDGENPVRILLKHISETPKLRPRSDRTGSALTAVVLRCLEKDPHERYQTAALLLRDLQKLESGKKILIVGPRWSKRTMRQIFSAIVVLAVLVPSTNYLLHVLQNKKFDHPVGPKETHYKGRNMTELTAAIEKTPNDPKLYYDRGWLHEMRDERTNALQDFNRALEISPNYGEALDQRAWIEMLLADYPKAIIDAQRAIQLMPKSAVAFTTLGDIFVSTEQYAKAVEQYHSAIKIEPRHRAYVGLGRALFNLSDYDGANAAFKKADEIKRTDLSNFILLVAAIYRQEEEIAKHCAEESMADPGKRGYDWGFVAYYYIWKNDWPSAEKALANMKSQDSFPARGYRIAGDLYRVAGHPEKAIEELNASTSLEEYPPGYRERALAHIDLGQWSSAEQDLEHSLTLNVKSPVTLSLMACVKARRSDNQSANELLGKAFSDGDRQPAIVYVNRAKVNLIQGHTEAALTDANKAISIDPWLKDAYALRADIRTKKGESRLAEEDKARAKELVCRLDIL